MIDNSNSIECEIVDYSELNAYFYSILSSISVKVALEEYVNERYKLV